jgi:hypothetical protein
MDWQRYATPAELLAWRNHKAVIDGVKRLALNDAIARVAHRQSEMTKIYNRARKRAQRKDGLCN